MSKTTYSISLIVMGVIFLVINNTMYIIGVLEDGQVVFLFLLIPVTILELSYLWLTGVVTKKSLNKRIDMMGICLNIIASIFIVVSMLTQALISKTLGWIGLSLAMTYIIAVGITRLQKYKTSLLAG